MYKCYYKCCISAIASEVFLPFLFCPYYDIDKKCCLQGFGKDNLLLDPLD